MLRSALLNVMIKAARKASRTLKRDFGEVEHLQASLKGPANFVTAADRRAEEILREELELEFGVQRRLRGRMRRSFGVGTHAPPPRPREVARGR